MVISPKGVAMLDNKTFKLDKVTKIEEVSFVSMDDKDKKVWSFISNNTDLGIMTCYNFKSRKVAADIAGDINDAFQITSGIQPHPPKEGPRRRYSAQEIQQLTAQARRKGSIKRASRGGSTKSGGSNTSADSDEVAMRVVGTHEAKYIASVAVNQAKGEQTVSHQSPSPPRMCSCVCCLRAWGGGGSAALPAQLCV